MASKQVWFSAPVTSQVRPPLSRAFCLSGLLVVRSGEMICQLWPRSVLKCTYCEP